MAAVVATDEWPRHGDGREVHSVRQEKARVAGAQYLEQYALPSVRRRNPVTTRLRLLNQRRLGDSRILLPPLCVFRALLVCCTLACINFVEGAVSPPSVRGSSAKACSRDAPGDAHNHLVTGIETNRGLHRERTGLHVTSYSLVSPEMESTAFIVALRFQRLNRCHCLGSIGRGVDLPVARLRNAPW